MRVFLLGLLLVGCAKDLTNDFEELSTRACKCADAKDAACGKAVLAELVTLVKDARKATANEPKAAASVRKLGECLLRSGVASLDISTAVNSIHADNKPPAEAPE